MKKRKNKIPAFIPNQRKDGNLRFDDGTRNETELRKQKENQKKLMINNKNNKY